MNIQQHYAQLATAYRDYPVVIFWDAGLGRFMSRNVAQWQMLRDANGDTSRYYLVTPWGYMSL